MSVIGQINYVTLHYKHPIAWDFAITCGAHPYPFQGSGLQLKL